MGRSRPLTPAFAFSEAGGNTQDPVRHRVLLRHSPNVGGIANTRAGLTTRFEDITPEGGVIELVVWRVPRLVPPTAHGFEYRAAYAVGGVRVVGFDNRRGKGDHCHVGGRERPYVFTTVEQWVEDFIAAVAAARSET